MHCRAVCIFLLLFGLLLPLGTAQPASARDGGETAAAREQRAARLAACGVPGELADRLLAPEQGPKPRPEDALALADELTDLCVQGLPIGPFADKTAEGLAKGIPAARIRAALEAKRDDYRFIRALLDPLAARRGERLADRLLVGGGECLALGLARSDAEALARAHTEASPEMLVTALRVLALTAQAGYPPADLRALVDTGLRLGTLTPDWAHLSTVALQARRRGVDDAALMAAARTALQEGAPLHELMTRLGATPRDPAGGVSAP